MNDDEQRKNSERKEGMEGTQKGRASMGRSSPSFSGFLAPGSGSGSGVALARLARVLAMAFQNR